MFQAKFAMIWWWPQNYVSIENNDLDIVYPLKIITSTLCIHWTLFSFPPSTNFWLLPRYSLSPLFVCKSFSFNSMTTIMLVMMPLKIKEMHLSREDENQLSIDLNIYQLSIDLNIYQFINWTEHSWIIKWLEYISIYQVTWTRTMLSSVLFWVLQVKTKLPIDLPLNDKDFNFMLIFWHNYVFLPMDKWICEGW